MGYEICMYTQYIAVKMYLSEILARGFFGLFMHGNLL